MASNKSKTNGSAEPATDTTTPVEHIEWKEAVVEGREIRARQVAAERDKYRLGEIAHKVVHPTYGDRTLAKYAEAIGEDTQRLRQYLSVWRAWDGAGIFAPGQISFAVLKELMNVKERGELVKAEPHMTKRRAEVLRVLKDHPAREEILSEHPGLSCTTQARNTMREYDTGVAEKTAKAGYAEFNETKRWLAKEVTRANNIISAAHARKETYSPKERENLVKAVAMAPDSLETMRRAGEEWLEFVDWWEEFEREAKDTASRENRVRTSPKPAQHQQPEA